MKLALLLPGYLDSPDYLHMKVFEKRLLKLGYSVERIDPCGLWKTDDVGVYSITNYLNTIKEAIDKHKNKEFKEILVLGHSLGGLVSILAGNRFEKITKVVSLCAPATVSKSFFKWSSDGFRNSRRDLPEDSSKYREFNVPRSFVDDGVKYSAIEDVRHLRKPLMILIGMKDDSVPPKITEQIVKVANNPHVVRLKNIGHNFRWSERETNLVMEEIEKFLLK
jgi:pimeloyl-ACP methyl ester carboxylesterase